MKRGLLILLVVTVTLSSAACSARLTSVGMIEPLTVRRGRSLDPHCLPSRVPVLCSDGKTVLRGVDWNIGSLANEPLYEDVTVYGTVAGSNLEAAVAVDVSVGDVDVLRLGESELADHDLPGIMERRARETVFVDEQVWSPDHSVLALILGEKVCVWRIGEAVPTAIAAIAPGFPYHDLGWSFDGKFISVYPHPSSESEIIALQFPELKVKCRLDVASVGFWSPDSHELLVTVRGSDGLDLSVVNLDTCTVRVILKADPTTVYRADGWAEPGVARYSRLRAQGPAAADMTDLVIDTR